MADTTPPLSELVSWLYGMHKASASMYDAVRSYAENAEGFYADELKKAVYATERSGADIYTAISDIAGSTKNPPFQKFLSEYLTTVKTSWNPEWYLKKKLEEQRVEEKLPRRNVHPHYLCSQKSSSRYLWRGFYLP